HTYSPPSFPTRRSSDLNYTQLANNDGTAYGLKPEVSWNTGLTFDQDFRLFGRESGMSLELFHNNFTNQVVVDWENPRAVSFYNLDRKSTRLNSSHVKIS